MLPSRFLPLCLALCVLVLGFGQSAQAQLNSQEQQLFNLLKNASGQGRPTVEVDPILSKVARARAVDMAKRRYYSHTNPDGKGPNYLVRQAGYPLPDIYSTSASANNIESVSAGYSSASSTWNTLMGSSSHKRHLLAQSSFYAEQTSVGIGYYADSGSEYEFYWVIITAPPAGPSLAISSPAANAGLTVPQATISGTTGGSPVAARVAWQLNGVGNYVNASGTKTWSANVSGLTPGVNTVRVQSFDASGALLGTVARSFRYVVLKPLTVAVEGSGKVSTGFLGTTQRELGVRYTVTATPATGWLFDHWSGSVQATTPSVSFTMQEGLELTAHFRVNPFYARKGVYNGLVLGGNGAHADSGSFKVTTTTSGSFTGKLLYGGKSYTASGKFDANGQATVTIKRTNLTPLVLNLQLDLEGGTDRITGTVSDGTVVSSLSADQALPTTAQHDAFGRYTVSLPPNPEDSGAEYPQGSGYAIMTVNKYGTASLSGALSDGKTFTYSSSVSKFGELPVYLSLLSGAGSLMGEISIAEDGTVSGTLRWTKPARPVDKFFPEGFVTDLPVEGASYVAPAAGTPALEVSLTDNNSALYLADGNLEGVTLQNATLSAKNSVVIKNPTLPSMSFTITPSTGKVTGSFKHPVTKTTARIYGVIRQDRNAATGFFLGQNESGVAIFAPSDSPEMIPPVQH